MRDRQSSLRSSLRRDIAPEPYSLNLVDKLPGLVRGETASAPGSVLNRGMFSGVGDPIKSQIMSSW